MKKILILCGYFAGENEAEVMEHARRVVEFSANTFQRRLISGFQSVAGDVEVLSAPFIGSFPNGSDILRFRGFRHSQKECRYVKFHNLWGFRNISRSVSLKRALSGFIEDKAEEKLLVVYSAHTPFIEAARYAKSRDPRIRVCLYLPDLPHYMNLSADRTSLYDFAKKYDIAHMLRQMDCADSYVLLTRQMADMLPVADKPCLIREGIIDTLPEAADPAPAGRDIVYTGKLDAAFGVDTLLEAFSLLEDPDCRLVLCGRGDCESRIRALAERDPRVCFLGQVSPEEAAARQRQAAVLVNPRPDREEYTKYSFPSKNIEYLLTGRPVAACMLSGMPGEYREFLYEIEDDTPRALAAALGAALKEDPARSDARYRSFLAYARERLLARNIVRDIMNL